MNYQWHYDRLIETRKQRVPEDGVYYEKHHIIMRSMGGTNDKENLIKLTAREHFLAHWLLWRIYRNNSSATAFFCMCNYKSKRRGKVIISSRTYAEAKECYSKNASILAKKRIGAKNPMFGKKQSAKTKKLISRKSKKRIEDDPGKYGWKSKQIFQYDLDKNLLKIWTSGKDCAIFYSMPFMSISNCAKYNSRTDIKKNRTSRGFIFSFSPLIGYNNIVNNELFKQAKTLPKIIFKPVELYQYNLQLELIKIWPSRKSFLRMYPKLSRRTLYKYAEYNSNSIDNFKELNENILSFKIIII